MTDSPIIARRAPRRIFVATALAKGDPVPLPLTMASIFNLPGDPAGFSQYGRFDNADLGRRRGDARPSGGCHGHRLSRPGMAAISAIFFGLLKTGDRVLLPSDGYYTPRVLAERFLKPLGIAFDLRPTTTYLDGGFDGYRMVFVETPSNPGLDICDIAAVAAAAHAAGAIVVADNTTMTPYGQLPLDLGADIVVAADTKAPNGHSDVLFGHVDQPRPGRDRCRSATGASCRAPFPVPSRPGWCIAAWRRLMSASTACARPPRSSRGACSDHPKVGGCPLSRPRRTTRRTISPAPRCSASAS